MRVALLRAKQIIFYKCSAKNPIIILNGFEATSINTGTERPADAAKRRTVTVHPFSNIKKHAFPQVADLPGLYRITAPTPLMQKLVADSCVFGIEVSVKDHHMEGWSIGHAFLTKQKADYVRTKNTTEHRTH